MSKLKMTMAVMAVLFTALLGRAQSFTLRAPATAVEGEKFTITFRITNANATLSRGNAPHLNGCTLVFGPGVSTMESYSYVNGRTESMVQRDFTFTYQAGKPGKVTVPALTIRDGNRSLSTRPATITIVAAGSGHRHSAPAPTPMPAPDEDDFDNFGEDRRVAGGDISSNDIAVTVTLSKDHVYENEAVIASIRVYTKHDISSFRATTVPSFDGFLSEELPINEKPHQTNFRGGTYYTVLVKQCLLYPQKAGKLTINSGTYDVTLVTYEVVSNGFFATQRPVSRSFTTNSNSVSVNVSPLPEPRPAGFNGAVGTSFNISTALDPTVVRTNEAATYTLKISGTGNVKYLTAPDLDFGNNVDEYDPETTTDTKFNGSDLTGTFTATYTFVPQVVGKFHMDATPFVYFNPQTGKYVTLEIPPLTTDIVRGSAAPASDKGSKEKKTMDDIRYINPTDEGALSREHPRFFNSFVYVLLYILIIAALITAIIVYRRHVKLSADIVGRRSARANNVASRRLKAARNFLHAHNTEKFHEALASAIWGYLSDKLAIPASALTRDNISEKMTAAGISPELVTRTIGVLDDCEMARFTPDGGNASASELYERAAAAINEIDSFRPAKAPKSDSSLK